MKPALFAVLALLWALAALAQGEQAGTESVAGASYQRIEETRSAEMAALAAEETACYQRFAVNDCLKKVQSRRRILEATLKRREALLHDAERQQQAAEQRQRAAQKAQERQQQEAETAARKNSAREADLLRAQQEKQAAHASGTASPAPPASPGATGPTPAEQAASRESFFAKQAAAEKKRQEIAKRLADKKTAKPVPSLPLPP